MKLWLIRQLLKHLAEQNIPSYRGLDKKEKIEEWQRELWASEIFQAYIRYRDLQILKTMGIGLDEKTYWYYLGRRTELQEFAAKSKELYDKYVKEKESQKVKVENQES